MKRKIRIIGGWMMPTIYCFPKQSYTKQEAIDYYKKYFETKLETIGQITEHQVKLFRWDERVSYEYAEYEEMIEYRYCDEFAPNKQYSEKIAPSCWCIEGKFTEEYDNIWLDILNKRLEEK